MEQSRFSKTIRHLILPTTISICITLCFYLLFQYGTSSLPEFHSEDFPVSIPVAVQFGDKGFIFPDLLEASQIQIDSLLASKGLRTNIHVILEDGFTNGSQVVTLESSYDSYSLFIVLNAEMAVYIDLEEPIGYLHYTLESIHSNDLPFFIAQAIVENLLEYELQLIEYNVHPNHLKNLKMEMLAKTRYKTLKVIERISEKLKISREKEFTTSFNSFLSLLTKYPRADWTRDLRDVEELLYKLEK